MNTKQNNHQIISPVVSSTNYSFDSMMRSNGLNTKIKLDDQKTEKGILTLTLDLHSAYHSNIYMELKKDQLIVSDIRVKNNKVENIKDYLIDLPESLAKDSTIVGYKDSNQLNIVLQTK